MGKERREGKFCKRNYTYRINVWFYARLHSRGSFPRIFTVILSLKTKVPINAYWKQIQGIGFTWASGKNIFFEPCRCDSDKWRQTLCRPIQVIFCYNFSLCLSFCLACAHWSFVEKSCAIANQSDALYFTPGSFTSNIYPLPSNRSIYLF